MFVVRECSLVMCVVCISFVCVKFKFDVWCLKSWGVNKFVNLIFLFFILM